MRTNIYLVRHAHSAYTPDELGRPLSADGLADAEKVTKHLENENIDMFISSPYKRAVQTVEGIAEFIGEEIRIVRDFKERLLSAEPVMDFHSAIAGVWENPVVSL